MLSILIPVYNYDIRPLAEQLSQQLSEVDITYEIIFQDDASNSSVSELNSKVELYEHIRYNRSSSNQGRTATRQLLAEQAKYDWLLFMDSDVIPKNDNYIEQYLLYLNKEVEAVYGGFAYLDEIPKVDHSLRWRYGRAKEQVSAEKRNRRPYKITISGNFLIQKSIFKELNRQIDQKGYGYDNYFASLLKQHEIKVLHIDNEVYHLGLESNSVYLNKVEASVKNLWTLNSSGSLSQNENSLLLTFKKIKRFKLNSFCSFLFHIFRQPMKRNLLNNKPSIFILQLYKLGYICFLDLKS